MTLLPLTVMHIAHKSIIQVASSQALSESGSLATVFFLGGTWSPSPLWKPIKINFFWQSHHHDEVDMVRHGIRSPWLHPSRRMAAVTKIQPSNRIQRRDGWEQPCFQLPGPWPMKSRPVSVGLVSFFFFFAHVYCFWRGPWFFWREITALVYVLARTAGVRHKAIISSPCMLRCRRSSSACMLRCQVLRF